MAFWGVMLKPGASKGVDSPKGDIMHLSQACLHEPKEGKNYVIAKVKGTSYALACLEKGKKEHDTFDLFFSSGECVFTNKGQSEVHLTGYFEPDGMGDDEESEEEAPPVKKESPKPKCPGSPLSSPLREVLKLASPKLEPLPPPMREPDASDEEDEDEESEEEAPQPSPGKRSAPAPAAGSPAKKAKADPQEAWVKAMHDYLKKNGKTNLGNMGTKVPRPADVPKTKLRPLFEQHKGRFSLEGDMVGAK